MFILGKKDTFKWPVQINVPKDGGGFMTHEFTAEFKLHEQSKMDEMIEHLREGDFDILRKLLVGWDGVNEPISDDPHEKETRPVPFNEVTRDRLIDLPYARTGLLEAYFKAASGTKVKRGN